MTRKSQSVANDASNNDHGPIQVLLTKKNESWNSISDERQENQMATFQIQISDDYIEIAPSAANAETQSGGGKNPASVARRNARERRRIKNVNSAFDELRQHVPHGDQNRKKISKVDTLQSAIEYIKALEDLVRSRRKNGYESEDKENQPELNSDRDSCGESPSRSNSTSCSDSEPDENAENGSGESVEIRSEITESMQKAFGIMLQKNAPKRRMSDESENERHAKISRSSDDLNCSFVPDSTVDASESGTDSLGNANLAQLSDSGYSDYFQSSRSNEEELFNSFKENDLVRLTSGESGAFNTENRDFSTDQESSISYLSDKPVQMHPLGCSSQTTFDPEVQTIELNSGEAFQQFHDNFQQASVDQIVVADYPEQVHDQLCGNSDWSSNTATNEWSLTAPDNQYIDHQWSFQPTLSPVEVDQNNGDLKLTCPLVPITIDQISPSIDFLPEKDDFSFPISSFHADSPIEQTPNSFAFSNQSTESCWVLAKLN